MAIGQRALSAVSTFAIGLLVGFLSAFASFSGRVATVEAATAAHTVALQRVSEKLDNLSDALADIRGQLARRGP